LIARFFPNNDALGSSRMILHQVRGVMRVQTIGRKICHREEAFEAVNVVIGQDRSLRRS
jgi:hypothetical protein